MLTFGVHTHITNPLSSGYLCYLSCIRSWARLADEVVVVDGGSTDKSLTVLGEWLGPLKERVRVISNVQTHWGQGEAWEWPQIAINRQAGLDCLGTDWAIHVDADHVAPSVSREVIVQDLAEHREALLLSMPITYYDNGVFLTRVRPRAWVLNLARVKASNLAVAYGVDRRDGTHLDYPLRIAGRRQFVEPGTGVYKQYFVGDFLPSEGLLKLGPFSMGHFFFTIQQCIAKCTRLARTVARFRGTCSETAFETRTTLRLRRICGRETKDALLGKAFSEEVRALMLERYQDDMMGGLLYSPVGPMGKVRELTGLALRASRLALRAARITRPLPTRAVVTPAPGEVAR
jgi:hypothetical protein